MCRYCTEFDIETRSWAHVPCECECKEYVRYEDGEKPSTFPLCSSCHHEDVPDPNTYYNNEDDSNG